MFQNDLLQDQTILITGGGTGLGRVGRLEDELGLVTGLVNNAAGNFLAPSEDLSWMGSAFVLPSACAKAGEVKARMQAMKPKKKG